MSAIMNYGNVEEFSNRLAEFTLEGKWHAVEEMYNEFPECHTAMIDDFVGTALHVAVDLDEEEVVEKLVNAIIRHETMEALEMRNDRGDSALHVAASRGFTKICELIIGTDKERIYLLSRRNKHGETPLFGAVANGRTQVFAYLSYILNHGATLQDLVRNNDLAIIILHYYDFLGAVMNKDGEVPLKVLATKPSAFYSSTYLSLLKRIQYLRVHVELFDDVEREMVEILKREMKPQKILHESCPQNYAVLTSAFTSLYGFFSLSGKLLSEPDPENNRLNLKPEGRFPPNYKTIFQFVQYVFALIWAAIGGVNELKETKKKHQLSPRLLKQLLKRPYEAMTGRGSVPYNIAIDADMYNVYNFYKENNLVAGETSQSRWLEEEDEEEEKEEENEKEEKEEEDEEDEEEEKDCKEDKMQKKGVNKSKPKMIDEKETPFLEAARNGIVEMVNEMLRRRPIILHETNSQGENVLLVAAKNRMQKKGVNKSKPKMIDEKETPFLEAARNGIVEMVNEMLRRRPSILHETNSQGENVLLVAAKNRKPIVIESLKENLKLEVWRTLCTAINKDGKTMLHMAGEDPADDTNSQVSYSALEMVWDAKWFQYVSSLVPPHYYFLRDKDQQTPREIFKKTHDNLRKESGEWLKETSESCSVVTALVAGASFATATTVPGGIDDNGMPHFEGNPAFDAFLFSSLFGLCFSVSGLIMFLTVLTSRKLPREYRKSLPLKLVFGLSFLFLSIISLLASFCIGHSFLFNHKYRKVIVPIYIATCFPVTFFALDQVQLYVDLLAAIFSTVPNATDHRQNL